MTVQNVTVTNRRERSAADNESQASRENTAIIFYMLAVLAVSALGIKFLQSINGTLSRSFTSMFVEAESLLLLLIFCRFTSFRMVRPAILTPEAVVRKSIRHGLKWMLAIGLLCVGARFVLSAVYPKINIRPWIQLQLNVKFRWLYFATAFIQEFLAKCVMQEKMKQLLNTTNIFYVIAACSLIFVILHGGYSVPYMLAAGGLNFLTGWVYEKDGSLWSSVMIHFACGFFPQTFGIY